MTTQSEPRTISYYPREFPPHRSWSYMTFEQLRNTLNWLYDEIGFDVAKEASIRKPLQVKEHTARFRAFKGAQMLMWTHRCNGVGSDGSRRAEYQVCAVGKSHDIIVEGELTFAIAE